MFGRSLVGTDDPAHRGSIREEPGLELLSCHPDDDRTGEVSNGFGQLASAISRAVRVYEHHEHVWAVDGPRVAQQLPKDGSLEEL